MFAKILRLEAHPTMLQHVAQSIPQLLTWVKTLKVTIKPGLLNKFSMGILLAMFSTFEASEPALRSVEHLSLDFDGDAFQTYWGGDAVAILTKAGLLWGKTVRGYGCRGQAFFNWGDDRYVYQVAQSFSQLRIMYTRTTRANHLQDATLTLERAARLGTIIPELKKVACLESDCEWEIKCAAFNHCGVHLITAIKTENTSIKGYSWGSKVSTNKM